jgi:hypothetical protein
MLYVVLRGQGDSPQPPEEITMNIDRSATARALAQAIAYKACGKDEKAADAARELVRLLGCAGILRA